MPRGVWAKGVLGREAKGDLGRGTKKDLGWESGEMKELLQENQTLQ